MNLTRRHLIAGSAATAAFAGLARMAQGAAAPATANQTHAGVEASVYTNQAQGYGALKTDPFGLFDLPEGFDYTVVSRAGDPMSDGLVTPYKMDGMGCFGLGGGRVALVRNHELAFGDADYGPLGVSHSLAGKLKPGTAYDRYLDDRALCGGTSTLIYDTKRRRLEVSHLSLTGTLTNCAGGITPWGSWLTCEEIDPKARYDTKDLHGWVFEVPSGLRGMAEPVPIRGLGRFKHEAAAIDPRTGIVYLTEDDRNKAGLYRFIPNDRRGRNGSLENGGRLQAARVRGRRNADLTVASIGQQFQLEWVDIEEPDLDSIAAPAGFADIGANDTLSGPFAQAWADGALRMSRGEGIWYSYGKLFIVDTSTGVDAQGRRGYGNGAVWVLDLFTQRLSALFVSGNQLAAHNPDNVTVSARGGVVLCEDGGESPDEYGPGARLLGLTRGGESFYLAKNNVQLTSQQIADAGKTVAEGDYRDTEFCGACWDPLARTLFVNIQTPGITLAITGPWERGPL